MKYVSGVGNQNAKLMIVGEAPGADEELAGQPFVGSTGRLVMDMLGKCGLHRNDVYLTNVVKVRPPANNLSRLKELNTSIDHFIPQLWEEIRSIRPNCVLALGNLALSTLTGKFGIQKWRGSVLHCLTYGLPKIVPSIHPASLLHAEKENPLQRGGMVSWRDRAFIQFDFARAKEQSEFKELISPYRNITICRSSLDLYEYLKRNKDKPRVALDIEMFASFIPVCVSLAHSPTDGISIPLFNLSSLPNVRHSPLTELSKSELVEIWRMLAKHFADVRVGKVGQNLKFDQQKLRSLGFILTNVVSDTCLKFRTLYPELPGSLQFMTSILTDEPYYKDEGREFNFAKDDLRKLLEYNAKDSLVTIECDNKMENMLEERGLKTFFYDKVMPLHHLYYEIETSGILYDPQKAKELDKKYSQQFKEGQTSLKDLIGYDINVNSPLAVRNLLFQDLKIPIRKSVDEKTLAGLLQNVIKDSRKKKIVEEILLQRKAGKTISTYVRAKPDTDGRMRCSFNIVGTETGRTSTQKLNKPVRHEKRGISFHAITKHGVIGADIGEMLIPDPGYVFLEVDESQAEARVVALLSNDLELLQMFDTRDIHKMTAAWAYECSEEIIDKKQRQVGKRLRHAGNYDMGPFELMRSITQEAYRQGSVIEISAWRAKKLLEVFHNKSPKIRNVFHKQVREELERSLTLINPFGRKRQFFNRWGDELFKEAYAQIPQSTVSDHLKFNGMLKAREELQDLVIVREAHDSFTMLVKETEVDIIARVVKKCLEAPIDFSICSLQRESLIIPCDFQVGQSSLYKMEKYELVADCSKSD